MFLKNIENKQSLYFVNKELKLAIAQPDGVCVCSIDLEQGLCACTGKFELFLSLMISSKIFEQSCSKLYALTLSPWREAFNLDFIFQNTR